MGLNLSLRGNVWYAIGTMTRADGKSVRVKRSTKFTLNQKRFASNLLSKIEAEIFSQTDEVKSKVRHDDTVAEMNKRYLGRPEGFLSKSSLWVLNAFDNAFGKMKVSDLDIKKVYSHFERKGTKPTSIRKEMAVLIASINHSKTRGFPFIIFTDVNGREVNLVKPPEGEGRLRWLTVKERDRLINCCDDTIKDLVSFLFFTGARLGNAFSLTNEHVIGDEVMLYSRKGRKRHMTWRKVPIVSSLRPILESRCNGGLVFPNPLGSQWRRSGVNNDGRKSDNTNFYHFWSEACEKAGITDFRPHDCRHTFASHLRQKGVGLDELKELLGHASLEMVMRYAHLAPSSLKSVIEHLDTSKDSSVPNLDQKDVVLTEGIEPSTPSLPMRHSTTELRQHTSNLNTTNCVDKSTVDALTKEVEAHPSDEKPP